jgi:hypothetical protein
MYLQFENGQYKRTGAESILVSRHSATGGRCESDPTSTIQIDANHSDMVKLTPGHHLIRILGHKLDSILHHDPEERLNPRLDLSPDSPTSSTSEPFVLIPEDGMGDLLEQFRHSALDPEFWDGKG